MNDLLPKMTEFKINLKKLQNYKKIVCMNI